MDLQSHVQILKAARLRSKQSVLMALMDSLPDDTMTVSASAKEWLTDDVYSTGVPFQPKAQW